MPLNQQEPICCDQSSRGLRSTVEPKHCWLQFTATCTERNVLAKCMFSVSEGLPISLAPHWFHFYNLGGCESHAFQRTGDQVLSFYFTGCLPSQSVFSALVSSGNFYVVREKKTKPITLIQPFLFCFLFFELSVLILVLFKFCRRVSFQCLHTVFSATSVLKSLNLLPRATWMYLFSSFVFMFVLTYMFVLFCFFPLWLFIL